MSTKQNNWEQIQERSGRFEAVIIKYFGKQRLFASAVGVSANTICKYATQELPISQKMAMKWQELAGVNADYILNGVEPMMLDESRIPIYTGKVPKRIPIRSTIKQYTIGGDNRRAVLNDNGEVNIAKVILGAEGKKPLPVMYKVINQDFCNAYNFKYGTDLIIVEMSAVDGDTVLVETNGQYRLCEYRNKKLTDKGANNDVISSKNARIIGVAVLKIEPM
ncbi:MAG: hypothetical protein LBO69_02980 [Ignavibacteria bacterium]|nr:hypothetical protein [Ignavibacteria bacterium]